MNIHDSVEEIKFDERGEAVRFPLFRRLFLALVIVLTAASAFGLGRLSVSGGKGWVEIEYDPSLVSQPAGLIPQTNQTAGAANALLPAGGGGVAQAPLSSSEVVASKNGSRYHFPHCGGAKQIKEENKIVFPSPAAAESAGYTLAANCKAR